jgi:hypothetical protein
MTGPVCRLAQIINTRARAWPSVRHPRPRMMPTWKLSILRRC